MTARELLEKLLRAYGDYYDVTRTEDTSRQNAAPRQEAAFRQNTEPRQEAASQVDKQPLFAAEAAFHSHEEQYFLVRAARIAEAESHEYVFFALEETLTADRLRELVAAAWERGSARVIPHRDHRNTDTALIVLADRIEPDALTLVPKVKHYRSYRWGLRGWSHFLLFAVEASTGRCAWNRQGQRLRKLIQSNIRET